MTNYKFRRRKLREYMLPEGKTAAAFVRSLRRIPGIRRVSSNKYDCTLYDSFDGRAYADGVILAWIDRKGSGVLQSMSAKDTVLLWEQPMSKPPPHFGWTLDQPARAQWLEKCMGLRSLLPTISLSMGRQSFRWTDDEDKTHAWVHVERIDTTKSDDRVPGGAGLSLSPCADITDPFRNWRK